MNSKLELYARSVLLEGLAKLPAENQRVFKLMYARGESKAGIPARTILEAEAVPIDQVVAEMPAGKLDWAMTQVDNSLKKLEVK